MSNPLMPVVAQLPAMRWDTHEPLLVLGFDATDALCVTADGKIEYVAHDLLRVDWTFDAEAGVWTSTTSTAEDATVVYSETIEPDVEHPPVQTG